MDSVIPAAFYCRSPSGWCITPPPIVALPPPPTDNNYILAFRIPLLDKMEAIQKSRSRFHRFNHCQYCTRDFIFSSLLKSDSFAIDRPQLTNLLEKALPLGSKFACKGHVEQWLGIIDVGCVATVERLPMFHFPGNRVEQTEYFFLQQNLFKIFAHILEDSCTEVLDDVRPDLVNLLEDLRQNEQSFKVIITTSQNQFRNSLTLGAPSLGSLSPSLSVCTAYSKAGPASTAGHPNSPAVAVATNNGALWLQKVEQKAESDSDLATVGNLTGEAVFKNIQPLCLSPASYGVLANLLHTTPVISQAHYLSPTLPQAVLDDRTSFSKRHSLKLRRSRKNRETDLAENSGHT